MFLLRLALAMGEPDVDALARRLTGPQLTEWMAYWHLEPFGDDWRRTARAAAFAAKAAGAQVDGDAEDKFLPSYREQPQTIEQMLSILGGCQGVTITRAE